MKIDAEFQVERGLYVLLKKHIKRQFKNYECNFGSSMDKAKGRPFYSQQTVGGNNWVLLFMPGNTIKVAYQGVRRSAMDGNCLGWKFKRYCPGEEACFEIAMNREKMNMKLELYGAIVEYHTSAQWEGKAIGFEDGPFVWGRNEDVIVLKRAVLPSPSNRGGRSRRRDSGGGEAIEVKKPTDEEELANAGYGEGEILLSTERLIYIKNR